MKKTLFAFFTATAVSFSALAATAPTVESAWVRATVPGQQATGAFMKITAKEPLQLVRVISPVAGTSELHEMKMVGDVMQMRAIPKLDLPAGKTVELKPGGYHLMLLDLRAPLPKDNTVPITLVFRDAKGAESKLELTVPVTMQPPGGGSAPMTHKP